MVIHENILTMIWTILLICGFMALLDFIKYRKKGRNQNDRSAKKEKE
jgi:cbb3-type cytochrome oxidase subunit 3